jgi:hypothetical protein
MTHKPQRHSPREEDWLDALRELRDEIHVLRIALDELREEVQWANRNGDRSGQRLPRPFVLTSMPLDPTAENWEINRVKPGDLPEASKSHAAVTQSSLF